MSTERRTRRVLRRILTACAIVAAACAAGAPAAPAGGVAGHRTLKMIWGPVNLPDGGSAFPTYHRLGVQVFQIELNWGQVAASKPRNPQDPNDPAYVWPSDLSQAVNEATRYHMRICILVIGVPNWATGRTTLYAAPRNAGDFGSFLTAATRRYRSVHEWMIWGEPNRNTNFQPMPANSHVGPERYALLLNAAYHALKGASRANVVIGGDTASYGTVNPAQFLRGMRLPNGKAPPLDYFGLNPYSARFPAPNQYVCCKGGRDIDDLTAMESQLRATYHRHVGLWLSEFTVSSVHNNYAFDFHVSLTDQARWVSAAFRLVDSMPFVVGLGWFNLLDQPPTIPLHLTTGLMTWNSKPKPAFYAYEHAS
jgi:hypothetical protein